MKKPTKAELHKLLKLGQREIKAWERFCKQVAEEMRKFYKI